MIARSLFPGFSSHLANGAQVFISSEPLCFCVAMLPDTRILARRDQDFGIGSMFVEAVIYLSFIVTAIASKTINRLFYLFQQGLDHLGIADAVGGQGGSLNFTAFRVNAHM